MGLSALPSFTRAAAVLCGAFVLSPAAGCGGAAPIAPTPAPDTGGGLIGSAAPELAAEVVAGEGPATIQEARGKVVIVDFWATYCHPCRRSFPRYQELVDRFAGALAVLAVSVDAPEDVSREQIEAFATEAGVKFKILWDKDQRAEKQYRPRRMPTAFVIDQGGVVRHVHAGYEDGEEETIAREIEALLSSASRAPAEAPPAAPEAAAPGPAEAPRDAAGAAP
ncbi:ahpC/TSA family protein [Sorangium cellulosum]|uniref:AhpC/TSA family protein n=1 Tax=Sorangium cellulosum TaxID=56 RepID=A0A2L0ERH0_SORCE|nr:TlpA disulfide reductase family protein [Sorangium cellulosum]AUX41875.1 ahpC/TSA family protein [Sorangium cellulosum]